MKKTARIIPLLIATALLFTIFSDSAFGKDQTGSAVRIPDYSDLSKLNRYSFVMTDAFDTVISVIAYCETPGEFNVLREEIENEYTRLHQLFDIYNSYPGVANIRDINVNAGVQPVEVSHEIIDLLELGKSMYNTTGGKVNIAFGSVISLWHDCREYSLSNPSSAMLPDNGALAEAAKHCSIDDIIIDREAGTVFISDSGTAIDVGAVAKGYATEMIADRLISEGRDFITINAGGNVRCIGTKPDGSKWNIGIANPNNPLQDTYIDIVQIAGGSAVTSGVYQRYFTVNGKNYHHIIDPDTLYPEDRYLSVSILTENSGFADAISTATFNMEYDEGRKFIENLAGVEAMWVMSDGSLEYSSGFKK